MIEWFIMVALGASIQVLGPFTETECQRVKALMFSGVNAVCVEKRLLRARGSA